MPMYTTLATDSTGKAKVCPECEEILKHTSGPGKSTYFIEKVYGTDEKYSCGNCDYEYPSKIGEPEPEQPVDAQLGIAKIPDTKQKGGDRDE